MNKEKLGQDELKQKEPVKKDINSQELEDITEDLMNTSLAVVYDFSRAKSSFDQEENNKALKEGVELIETKFKKALEQKGLKAMQVKEGQKFDAEIHEAISQIPAPKKKLKGKIVDTIEVGYNLGENVIRFAKVVIGT